MAAFEAALLRSLDQAMKGEYAAVHTPAQIAARRGRPVGGTKETAKHPTTLRMDEAALAR